MEAKLTLKLNAKTIGRAKQYIRNHRGISLSRLVENYFDALTDDRRRSSVSMPPIVSSLAGIAKKSSVFDLKDDYADYLTKKYR